MRLMSNFGFVLLFPLALQAASLTTQGTSGQESKMKTGPALASVKGWGSLTTYGFNVAPQSELHVRLRHPKQAWLYLFMWTPGDLTPRKSLMAKGALRIGTGDPESWFINPGDQPKVIYVTVRDNARWSTKEAPYTLEFDQKLDSTTMGKPLDPWIVDITPGSIPRWLISAQNQE